jgi:hypothetical protein
MNTIREVGFNVDFCFFNNRIAIAEICFNVDLWKSEATFEIVQSKSIYGIDSKRSFFF